MAEMMAAANPYSAAIGELIKTARKKSTPDNKLL